MLPLLKPELNLYKRGYSYVVGVDEAGRGPLAGPMVVAAVVFEKKRLQSVFRNNDVEEEIFKAYSQINDSKKISEKKRSRLSEFIKKEANFSIQVISREIIDTKGITQATQMGFFNAVTNVGKVDHILTDNFKINALDEKIQTNMPKGDSLSISIAAASILAKVHRDNIMLELHEKFPLYEFEKHKGYGTKRHIELIKKHGPCEVHRHTFAPVRNL